MQSRFGISYRPDWDDELGAHLHQFDCFELILEQVELLNPLVVEQLRMKPLALHSVSLSVGSAEPLKEERLVRADAAVSLLEPEWLGVHMAITEIGGLELGQLTPILFTRANMDVVVAHIRGLKRRLGIDILLENIACYFRPLGDGLKEWEVLTEIVEQADCGLLLDLNNLHVNCSNLGYDPVDFLDGIPLERVKQVHLAGYEVRDGMLVDAHRDPTSGEVLHLLSKVGTKVQPPMVVIERDGNIPALRDMIDELERARSALHRASAATCQAQEATAIHR